MMKTKWTWIASPVLALVVLTPLGAQIRQRKENQQQRIAEGVENGSLTAGETAKLEGKEAKLNKEIAKDRAANSGKLTPAEKAQVNKQQNQLSNQIYNQKHDAQTAKYGSGTVGQRRENQQDRIAQGIENKSLTAGETAKLEGKEAKLNKEIAADRAANGGKLTPAEKQQVNHQQNALSKQIYKQKHDAQKR